MFPGHGDPRLIDIRQPVARRAGVSESCPLCGASLVEIRAKAVCARCGRIVEGCCEGAPEGCSPSTGRAPTWGSPGFGR